MRNAPHDSPVDPRVSRPVFLVGMGRSGTTLVFESFARNRELGWFNYHLERMPSRAPLAALARLCDLSPAFRKEVVPSGDRRRPGERFRDGPSEAWAVWRHLCGEKFLFEYLLETRADEAERLRTRAFVARVLRWQGKARFAAKLTGPARIGFLMSIFPDACFVHVVRDGRAVVDSLLHIAFWRDSFRMQQPAWRGGLDDAALARWEESGRDPLVLTALQWRCVVERTWEERDRHAPQAFVELRYEDFLGDPTGSMERVCAAVGVRFSDEARSWLDERRGLRPGEEHYRERLGPERVALLENLLGDVLERLGYAVSSPA